MARKRNKENMGLPTGWRYYHGAYRYQVPKGQEAHWDGKRQFTLGKTLPEAYRAWAERIDQEDDKKSITNVAQLLERYALEVIPEKSPRTQVDNRRQLPILVRRFGHFSVAAPNQPEAHHIYEYLKRNKARLTAAHREIELLSHAFSMAVTWGTIKKHPWLNQLRLPSYLTLKPADRYVEDWEVIEALQLKPRRKRGSVLMCQAYIRIKLLTGLRQTDLLKLRLADMNEEGIYIRASKTARTTSAKQLFTWTPELEQAVAMAKAARPIDIGPWLFCNRRGDCYLDESNRAHGFQSIWGRFMRRALAETALAERFTERDLRAKAASDAESLERARELLGHANARLTKQVYMRKAQRVAPAMGILKSAR